MQGRANLVKIYQCLCDATRLRILGLLGEGPLCVCHIQGVLWEPQVKISKHLAYLKSRGLVESRREANWMIYSLPARRSAELEWNLACLQDCMREDKAFSRDRQKLLRLRPALAGNGPPCCPPRSARRQMAASSP